MTRRHERGTDAAPILILAVVLAFGVTLAVLGAVMAS